VDGWFSLVSEGGRRTRFRGAGRRGWGLCEIVELVQRRREWGRARAVAAGGGELQHPGGRE